MHLGIAEEWLRKVLEGQDAVETESHAH